MNDFKSPPSKQQHLNIPATPRLQVRINQIDYVLAPPGKLDNSSLPQVPVLRIFGSSSTGQAACVHVHQIYPYFYVEYSGKLSPKNVQSYISKLSRSLNHAITFSLKRNPRSPKSQFVRAIVLVKGVHFYGFHASYSPFLKIYAADPGYVSRMVSILQSGSVMGTRLRVFESHLSYILQFLCDFDLHGCGNIDIEDALERCPNVPDDGTDLPELNAPKFNLSPYFRESRLPLEVDIIPAHILNGRCLIARNIHYCLHTTTPSLPADPLIPSLRELWEDERNHRREFGLNPSPEMPIDPSESSRDTSGQWISEARWWDEIRQRIQMEGATSIPNSDRTEHEWERFVMTTFESVEALWEKEYKTWKPAKRPVEICEKDGNGAENAQPSDYSWNFHNDSESDEKSIPVEFDSSMLSEQDINCLDQEEEPWNEDIHEPQEDEEENIDEDNIHEEDAQPGSPVPHPETDLDIEDADPFQEDQEALQTQPQEYELKAPPSPPSNFEDREGSPTPAKASDIQLVRNSVMPPNNRVSTNVLTLDPALDLTSAKPTFSQCHIIDLELVPELVPNADSLDVSDSEPYGGASQTKDVIPIATPTLTAEERLSLITARAVSLVQAFNNCKATNSNQYEFSVQPPSWNLLLAELKTLGLPSKIYQAPYYSRDEDIPEQPKEFAGLLYRLKGGQGIATLDEWTTHGDTCFGAYQSCSTRQLDPSGVGGWEYANHPPSVKEVRRSLHLVDSRLVSGSPNTTKPTFQSQIEGPTQSMLHGINTAPLAGKKPVREGPDMSVLSLEVFVPTVEAKVPNPETDAVAAIFCAYQVSGKDNVQSSSLVLAGSQLDLKRLRYPNVEVLSDELDLLNKLIDIVIEIDPDILTGWEVQNNSWGYLEARGATYGISISELISRAPPKETRSSNDSWALRKASTLKICGRHVLNLWRIMRSERNLTVYTFENAVFEVLGRRAPRYSYRTLTDWYNSDIPAHGSYLLRYMLMHTMVNLELLELTEVITKTAEFARVFGVDFFSIISRGSQFKVESFMFRLAKPESFVLISPSKSEVGKQNAAECMPLIMEPASAFYSSPVLVLDFQSLYPSIMIGYNYCYSTCLGRVADFQGRNQFGVVDDLKLPPHLLTTLQDHITVSPNGMIYVKKNVRKGLLGRMLIELLETRVMVKQAMKRAGVDKTRKRILDARQLSLKYIANVTYGYTGASFSGRMPAVEVADSIVQSGRETLEKAIDLIDGTAKWGAKVVYGDTDSVFVHLPGKTKEEAFALGYEIADVITALNPVPIKLKFEKVYLPCVLMAKKRYVGFKYESTDDLEPVFDAKGIETVRRDGVLAQRKMVETCLKILFRTQDLSEVKDYCCRSWTKILENKASVQDFIFSKEVKIGTYRSERGPPPPGAVVAAQKMMIDPNDEPKYGDRIPYVIARSATGARLVDRAIDPFMFMDNSELRLDANYYITKVLIPPLERIFNLVGADVKQWFNEMPRTIVPELVSPTKKKTAPSQISSSPEKININGHFFSTQCLSCGEPASQYLCEDCFCAKAETLVNLNSRIKIREERLKNTHRVCVSCTNISSAEPIQCESLDCPWFYARRKAQTGMELVPLLSQVSGDLEEAIRDIEDGDEGSIRYDDVYDFDSVSGAESSEAYMNDAVEE